MAIKHLARNGFIHSSLLDQVEPALQVRHAGWGTPNFTPDTFLLDTFTPDRVLSRGYERRISRRRRLSFFHSPSRGFISNPIIDAKHSRLPQRLSEQRLQRMLLAKREPHRYLN
ncbi:hypothetical protein CDAR_264081 [Caerostris darwini]|uniref:Uncharacterized protein n=1 Tax=Caerostris darwini TaxID=1538125 RepID=A0AAV4T9I3_9ARAC|nr:hypothetical protein CDAR_264081 [Caerostris darwini]